LSAISTQDGRLTWQLPGEIRTAPKSERVLVSTARFAPLVAFTDNEGAVLVFDYKAGAMVGRWRAPSADLLALELTPDGREVVLATAGGVVEKRAVLNGVVTAKREGLTDPRERLGRFPVFTPDGRLLFCLEEHHVVALDATDLRPVFQMDPRNFGDFTVSADSSTGTILQLGGFVSTTDLRTGKALSWFHVGGNGRLGKGWPERVALSPHGTCIAVASRYMIKVFETRTATELDAFKLEVDEWDYDIPDLRFSDDGTSLSCISMGGVLQVFDTTIPAAFRANQVEEAVVRLRLQGAHKFDSSEVREIREATGEDVRSIKPLTGDAVDDTLFGGWKVNRALVHDFELRAIEQARKDGLSRKLWRSLQRWTKRLRTIARIYYPRNANQA
jgi:hypothetical protein